MCVCLQNLVHVCHESVVISVRVLELWGDRLGGDACSYPQGGSLMVSESRGKVGRYFPTLWPVCEPV
jgi:hypothetical protein